MPVKKSAAKALRRDTTRAAHNRSIRLSVKYLVKQAHREAKSGAETAAAAVTAAVKALDRAAQKKVIPKNAAARTKSRLAADLRRPKTTVKRPA